MKMHRNQVCLDYDLCDCKVQTTWQHHLLCHTSKRSRNRACLAQKCYMCMKRSKILERGGSNSLSQSPRPDPIPSNSTNSVMKVQVHDQSLFNGLPPLQPHHRKLLVCNSLVDNPQPNYSMNYGQASCTCCIQRDSFLTAIFSCITTHIREQLENNKKTF